ncbi:hypothetical protein LOK49_LG11G00381 [Camellia lanceoleosa]|uniref:Uncharacterized protein n=1 Tax=Camellia lanceoleosa TaxID=1840588 RepID=A0ACC0G1W6_9ERIC|nr:hypothetical protein LOK49_LG11G00381 [Camellia lanceoleosa]
MDSVLKELKQLINSEDNLIANESHQIQSLYYDPRFLGAILKDMGEKQLHEQNDEAENLAMQISCVAYETGEIIGSIVANVVRQRDSNKEAAADHSYPCVLENLRTITNLEPSQTQDLLARTPHLTKLGFCGYLISDSRHLVLPDLEFLRHLETLKLHNLSLLKSMDLQGVKFPVNIKRLTLKYTGMEWEEISVLGLLLPNLELLKLESNAAWGWKWETIDGGFPRLKIFKLIRLNLEQWITCSSHFPSLQHLSLEMCAYLEEIPFCLGDIFTLQMIEVATGHPYAEESARKIKEEQESIGNSWLKVMIDNTLVYGELLSLCNNTTSIAIILECCLCSTCVQIKWLAMEYGDFNEDWLMGAARCSTSAWF